MNLQNNRPVSPWTYIAVVLGVALGLSVSLGPSTHATAGIFMRPLHAEFGWGRFVVSLSHSASFLGLTLGSPLIGMLMDRFGVRRVIMLIGVIYGLVFAAMSLQNGGVAIWVGLSLLGGICGASVSVVSYLSVLPQWFDRHLGLALGLATMGLGIGVIVMPPIAQYLVTTFGWRTAYLILGGGTIPVTLLACALIKERKGVNSAVRDGHRRSDATAEGHSLAEAIRSYRLWAIWLTFLIGSSCTLALVPQLPAMLADRGFGPADAARGVSMLGFGLLAGRFITGVLIDRVHAPFVACIFFIAGAAGALLLHFSQSYSSLLVAAGLIGLTIGAEGDLISYLVRAYFGVRSFGTLYGIAYSGYGLGSVIGPLAIGAYFDQHGNYELPLIVLPLLLLTASALVLTLGRYRVNGNNPDGLTSSLTEA